MKVGNTETNMKNFIMGLKVLLGVVGLNLLILGLPFAFRRAADASSVYLVDANCKVIGFITWWGHAGVVVELDCGQMDGYAIDDNFVAAVANDPERPFKCTLYGKDGMAHCVFTEE